MPYPVLPPEPPPILAAATVDGVASEQNPSPVLPAPAGDSSGHPPSGKSETRSDKPADRAAPIAAPPQPHTPTPPDMMPPEFTANEPELPPPVSPRVSESASPAVSPPSRSPAPARPVGIEAVPQLSEFEDGSQTSAAQLNGSASPAPATVEYGWRSLNVELPNPALTPPRSPQTYPLPLAEALAQTLTNREASAADPVDPADPTDAPPTSPRPTPPAARPASPGRNSDFSDPLANPDELIFTPGRSVNLELPDASIPPPRIDVNDRDQPERPELVIPATPEPPATATDPPAADPDSPDTLEEAILELTADRQVYDSINRIFRAEGRVVMRYGGAVIDADQLFVNLVDRVAVANGNVALTRGEQVIRGEAFEYNFVQQTGVLQGARGELFLPTAGSDLSAPSPSDPAWDQRPLSDREQATRPLSQVINTGNIAFTLGGNASTLPQGGVQRVRFEADEIDFYPGGWIARNIRLTNDPFSPPELEVRADSAELVQVSPLRDEILLDRPRLVFDQGLSVPLLRDRLVIDRRDRQPGLFAIGFDDEDRGGLFIEREFELINEPAFRITVTPQILVQRGLTDLGFGSPDSYGLLTTIEGILGPRTSYQGNAELSTLDPEDFENELRANVRLQQLIGIGNLPEPHRLTVEYSYRDRLFNGSLGFQDVRQSIGAVLQSPSIPLGNTGILLSYQLGAQSITADTDRFDLIDFDSGNFRTNLERFQFSVGVSRGFTLWVGDPLPSTREEGLRYSAVPIVPYLVLGLNARGTTSQYSNGESQDVLSAGVGLFGQIGHFSRTFFDYTAFNVQYSESLINGQSPFFFDRIVDKRVLSYGLRQQVAGPVLVGFQRTVNTDTNRELSMNYSIEYSRRTYSLGVNYNATEGIGFVFLRINDFNWDGTPSQFGGSGVRRVEGGVVPVD